MFATPPYLSASNIYEVNIRQFTAEGTFQSFALHLSRLKKMGVDILWLMPIFPIGKKNRKGTLGSYYSISDFKNVNPEFGTTDAFRYLVDSAHAKGMKVILDWVANHTAWDNVWTNDHPDFFCRNQNNEFIAPYDWDDVIQIDHKNISEQAAMIDAMAWWIQQFDIDGFRADLAHLTPLPFWMNARSALQQIKPNLIWLAETEDVSYHAAFDISFTWQWMHASQQYIQNNLADEYFIEAIEKSYQSFPDSALRLFFTANHDENSWNGTEYEKYGQFAKAMAVCTCTLPASVPLIYSGQEAANKKRLRFFEKDTIDWYSGEDISSFYSTLLSLRKSYPIFKGDKPVIEFLQLKQRVIGYLLKKDHLQVLVVLNFSFDVFNGKIHHPLLYGKYMNIFTNKNIDLHNGITLSIASGGFEVYMRN